MTQETLVPTPQTLSPEELNRRMDDIVKQIQKDHGCTGLVVNMVEAIVDRDHGGSSQNVYRLLPQFFVAKDGTSKRYLDERLDLDGDHVVEVHELEAAVLAAATLKSQGVNLDDVQINDQFLNLARAKCADVTKTVCSVER